MIDQANDALQAKGYSAAHLSAVAAPLPGKVLLKGTKILSPFSDTEEVVVRVARDFVPSGSGARAADADSARDSRLAGGVVISDGAPVTEVALRLELKYLALAGI